MNKLEKNYLNIPIIETERLILNYPVETDFKILEVFLKSERSNDDFPLPGSNGGFGSSLCPFVSGL